MASWRTVHGHIQQLDRWLVTDEDVHAFFKDMRILGRGASDGDGGFDFEVAVAGRRRRVATLDDNGTVFRGRSVTDLVDVMRETLRKVEVELDGEVAHGPIDLGSVDVSDEALLDDLKNEDRGGEDAHADDAAGAGGATGADLAGADLSDTKNADATSAEGAAGAGADGQGEDSGEGSGNAEKAEADGTGADGNETENAGAEDGEPGEAEAGQDAFDDGLDEAFEREGPMLVVVDLPLSEVPSVAANADEAIAASKLGDALVLTAMNTLPSVRRLFPRPSYQIILSAGRAEENPTLYVRRDNQQLTWSWEGELPIFRWIEPGSDAHDFVVDETGAGAVARRAVADVIDARFADIRQALQASPANGMRSLIAALNLPAEIADVMEGERGLGDIPNSKLFLPGSGGSAFEDRIAYEVAGEGFVEPDLMGAYRKIYLERPWAVAVASAVQTAVAGGLLVSGYTRANAGKSWKLLAALGGWTLVAGIGRILTTSYVQTLMSQRKSDIETWKMMRNLQENQQENNG